MIEQIRLEMIMAFSILNLLAGCQFQDREQEEFIPPGAKQELLQGKLLHLSWLINQEKSDFEAIVSRNEEIRRDFEAIATVERFDALVEAVRKGGNNFYGAVSPDGQLVVITWETGLDRLGYDLKSMALFKYDGKIMVSSLYGNPKIYKGIQQIKGANGLPNYILKESAEEGSSSDTYAYRISNGYLEPVSLDDTFITQRWHVSDSMGISG